MTNQFFFSFLFLLCIPVTYSRFPIFKMYIVLASNKFTDCRLSQCQCFRPWKVPILLYLTPSYFSVVMHICISIYYYALYFKCIIYFQPRLRKRITFCRIYRRSTRCTTFPFSIQCIRSSTIQKVIYTETYNTYTRILYYINNTTTIYFLSLECACNFIIENTLTFCDFGLDFSDSKLCAKNSTA